MIRTGADGRVTAWPFVTGRLRPRRRRVFAVPHGDVPAYTPAMASFNAPAPVLPLYTRAPDGPSRVRRALVVVAQVVAAAAYGFAAVILPPSLLPMLMAPVVLSLLLALWLMPDRGIFPFTAIERTYSVLLVLMVVWPVYIAVVLPGLPWLTPTRMALFVVTFFFLYSVSTSRLLRLHLAAVARSSRPLWIAFLLWVASMFISVPFSHHLSTTLTILLNNQLRLVEIFFVGCLIFARRGAATRTVATLIVLAMVSAVDGFIEMKLEYPPWAHHIPSFMRVDDATMATVLGSQARSADGLYRVRGPFPLSLVFAEYLAMCMPFIIHWLVTGRTLLMKAAMAVAWVMVMAAIVVTHSRLGLVGALLAHMTYLPLWAFRRWRADRTALLGPFVLFGAPVAALMLLGVVLSSHTLRSHVLGGGAQAASDLARAQQRAMAVPRVAHNPIGYGLGQSGQTLGFTNQGGYTTVDNHIITSLLEIGVVGTLSFYGMFVIAATIGTRLYLTATERELELGGPLAIMFLVFFVIKTVLSQENNHSLVLLLLGMMLALSARAKRLIDPDRLFPTMG